MKKLRLIALGTGTLLVAAGGALVACSEDTVVNPADSGTDSPQETTTTDGGPDTGTDTGADTGTDAPPPFDGGSAQFDDQLAAALCRSAARCCFGSATTAADASVDGGFYDQAHCLQIYKAGGFENSLRGIAQLDAGSLTLDPQKAADCLQGAETVACSLPGATLAALRTTCFDAIHGTTPAGGLCNVSAECAKGTFCDIGPDAGVDASSGSTGKCEALRAAGGPCGDFTGNQALIDEACSWRGMGGDQFCQWYDPGFVNPLPQDQWHCEAANATGGNCLLDSWCTSGLCDGFGQTPSYQCKSPGIFFPADGVCNVLVKP